jgi:hypothetical protein
VGDPENVWVIGADVVWDGIAAQPIDVTAYSEQVGVYLATAGSITTILTPVPSWSTVTNGVDAIPGTLVESDVSFQLERELRLSIGGSTHVDSLRAALLDPNGLALEAAQVWENEKHWPVYHDVHFSLPVGEPITPNSIECVWYDGVGTINDSRITAISETIWETKAASTRAWGINVGNSTSLREWPILDAQGHTHIIAHTRATIVIIEQDWNLVPGTNWPGTTAFKQFLVDEFTRRFSIGDGVKWAECLAFAFLNRDWVLELNSFTHNRSGGGPSIANLPMHVREIPLLDAGGITVVV